MTPQAEKKKFPASVPRKMYRSNEVGGHNLCPDCNSTIETEPHTFYIAVRHAGTEEFAMVGTDGGWFCQNCPVVVLDTRTFNRYALMGVPSKVKQVPYLELGIVDHAAQPEEKRHLPFGKDHPVPLVPFLNHKRVGDQPDLEAAIADTDGAQNSILATSSGIVKALTHNRGEFPRDAVLAAQDRREEVAPLLLAALNTAIEQAPELAKDSIYMLHLYALYLLAEFKETKAYPVIVELMKRQGHSPDDFFGDAICEDLDRILVSVCGGDATLIKQLVENTAVDEDVRSASLRALNLLVFAGVTPRDDAIAYMKWLLTAGLEREPSLAWDSLALCAMKLHPGELMPQLERAYEEDLVNPGYVALGSIQEEAQEDQAETIAYYKEQRPWYIADTVEEMEGWACFSSKATRKPFPGLLPHKPHVPAPPKKVKTGRNEPCPCGSGKKYKKCCGR